jgi:hypothetical protein
MTAVITVKELSKSCGDCTACCSGNLSGEAHGHKFYKGRPCFFVRKTGCSIYEDRPENPCKSFRCGYLVHPFFPEWMRPDQCGVIATPRLHLYKEGEETKSLSYLHLTEYGRPMSGQVLWWFVEKFLSGDIPNMLINIEGGHHRLGVPEFYRADL